MSRTNSRHNVWEHGIYNPNDTQLDSNSFRAFKEQDNKLSQMENALRKEMMKAEEHHRGLRTSQDRKSSIGYSNPTELDRGKFTGLRAS